MARAPDSQHRWRDQTEGQEMKLGQGVTLAREPNPPGQRAAQFPAGDVSISALESPMANEQAARRLIVASLIGLAMTAIIAFEMRGQDLPVGPYVRCVNTDCAWPNWLTDDTASLFATKPITLSGSATTTGFQVATPKPQASSVAGRSLFLNASDAVAGLTTAGAAAGGDLFYTAGVAKRNTSGNANAGNYVFAESLGIGTGHASQIISPVGVAAAPGFAFTGDTNTGFYDLVAFHYVYGVSNGTEHMRFGGGLFQLLGPVAVLSSVGGALPGVMQWIPSVEVVTTTKTPGVLESPEIYTNTGDTDGQAVTLPNDPAIGACFEFYVTATDASGLFSVAPSAGETIQAAAAACATSYTATAKGNSARICAVTGGSGAIWGVMSHEGTWICT